MRPSTTKSAFIIAASLAVLPAAARQDVALKDLMPKEMVIGVPLNERQSDGTDAAAVDIKFMMTTRLIVYTVPAHGIVVSTLEAR